MTGILNNRVESHSIVGCGLVLDKALERECAVTDVSKDATEAGREPKLRMCVGRASELFLKIGGSIFSVVVKRKFCRNEVMHYPQGALPLRVLGQFKAQNNPDAPFLLGN